VSDSPLFKQAQIPRPEDVKDRSTVSLHLLVKNGESVVGRLIDNVGPYVDEVVVVANDCTDRTVEVLDEAVCIKLGKSLKVHRVTAKTHPELYILDTKATYEEVGSPLAEEQIAGPFTEAPILADWSAARNIGWDACTSKWRLFLDADDVVLDPEAIPGLIKLLEESHAEIGISSYQFSVDADGRPKGSSFRERLALNVPRIRWIFPIHEVLAGSTRVAHVQGNLVVRDMRDNRGAGIRIPGRNFKILYRKARELNWEISPRHFANLVMETRYVAGDVGMLDFADTLLARYLKASTWPEERGWVRALVGEMHEGAGELEKAIGMYYESLAEHPGTKTAFRLCRALFERAREMKDAGEGPEKVAETWRDCVAAYTKGVEHKVVHQVLDDGPLFEEMEKIHVTGALMELGEFEVAKRFADEAVAAFPENSPLAVMAAEAGRLVAAKPKEQP
jgi:glycosyltransferase involved in cell wall biosynthesis